MDHMHFVADLADRSIVFVYRNLGWVNLSMIIVLIVSCVILSGFLKPDKDKDDSVYRR